MRPPIGLIMLTMLVAVTVTCSVITSCQKLGVVGQARQLVGDWAQVRLPDGCTPKQIVAWAFFKYVFND